MNPLYSVSQIRAIEADAASRLPYGTLGTLMRRAGQAGADAALAMLPVPASGARVLVLAGPGNNGGDALETAAHLALAGAQVLVVDFGSAEPGPGMAPGERHDALQRARSSGAVFIAPDALAGQPQGDWQLVIDGLFGIGLKRPLTGALRDVVDAVNALRCPVLALDLPSGLDGDTGCVVGPDGVAIHATRTLTFIGDKPGLHTCDGQDYAGGVDVARLDLAPELSLLSLPLPLPATQLQLNDVTLFSRQLARRRQNSHKGSYGNLAVIGGARGMAGAPLLAARSALHAGAGRVFALFAEDAPSHDAGQPELMCRLAVDYDINDATLVVGPGLGASRQAQELLARAIDSTSMLLLDADALNLLAAPEQAALRATLALRPASCVLTPHPLEAARMLGVPVAEVQADRVAAARKLAEQFQAVVVLKGSGTVIAAPGGNAVINTTGNPALATAGTGDVLSGLCGSLLAQHWPLWEAALAAVYLHGLAADMLVAEGAGPIGLTAGEFIPAIRTALNRMVQRHASA